jgi:hypothetical protein
MNEWAKVVTEPLGLAGFALFLIFTYLGKTKQADHRKWLSPMAFGCAAITLVGGLTLAYLQITKPTQAPASLSKPAPPPIQQTNQVQQLSTGQGSPNVQGVQGDVTITVDQSNGSKGSPKTVAARPKP